MTAKLKPELAQLVLMALGTQEHLAAILVGTTGHEIWRTAGCHFLDEFLTPKGPIFLAMAEGPAPTPRVVRVSAKNQVEMRSVELGKEGTGTQDGYVQPGARLWTFKKLPDELRLSRALENSQARLRLLSAHTEGIIFELDSRGRHVRVWTSDPKLLASPEEELLGKTVLDALGPEQGRQHHEAVMRTVQSGEPAHYEYELDVPSGKRHFACESVAVPAPDGKGRHAVFWIRDVTTEVQLRNERYETERLASLGTLASGIAHEINNPLGYMLLNAEHLRRRIAELNHSGTPLDDFQAIADNADMLHAGTLRVRGIVRDLLELAKTRASTAPVDVWEALSAALEATEPARKGRTRLSIQKQMVPQVNAHHGRLVQVFTNLMTNAVDAIPEGAPDDHCVTASLMKRLGGGVEIRIEDTGTGVEPAHRSRIFDPFYTTKDHGTGLGLAICQRIVRSFGGELLYAPQPNGGSRFVVKLPSISSAPKPSAGPPLASSCSLSARS